MRQRDRVRLDEPVFKKKQSKVLDFDPTVEDDNDRLFKLMCSQQPPEVTVPPPQLDQPKTEQTPLPSTATAVLDKVKKEEIIPADVSDYNVGSLQRFAKKNRKHGVKQVQKVK